MLMFANRMLRFVFVCLALVLASGCAAPTQSPEPVNPTAVLQAATATPLPPSPTPTETPLPPTATYTQVPPTPTDTETPEPTHTPTETPTHTPTATTTPLPASSGWGSSGKALLVYYIHLDTGGTVGCGDSVVGVSTGLERTNDIAADVSKALSVLFANKSKYWGELYNPVSFSNLAVENVSFDDGLITVNLRGTYIPTGDDCDNTRVKAQVWQTIRQYRDVTSTNIYLNGGPFGDKVSNDK